MYSFFDKSSLLGRSVLYYLQYLNNYLGQLINLKHTQLILNLYICLGMPKREKLLREIPYYLFLE